MSAAEADRFIADVKASPERFDGLQTLAEGGHADEAFAKVQAMGYDATQDEIREAFLEFASEHLDEHQLAAVAGGLSNTAIGNVVLGVGFGAAVVVGVSAAAAAI
jgi:hypothetical protein